MDPVSISSFGIAGILYLILQIVVTGHIICRKDDVKSSFGWIGLVWLTPLVGSIIYVVFGINRIRRRALSLRNKGPDIFTLTGKSEEELRAEALRKEEEEKAKLAEKEAKKKQKVIEVKEVRLSPNIDTNDLIQYTLAVDRQNPTVNSYYNTRHPAVMRMIEMVTRSAHEAGIQVAVSGDMADDSRLTEWFIRIGVDILSVSAASILPLRQTVRDLDLSDDTETGH